MPTYDKRRVTGRRNGRIRAVRPKTFANEEAAKTYAEANEIKKYKLVDISPTEKKVKIRIVEE